MEASGLCEEVAGRGRMTRSDYFRPVGGGIFRPVLCEEPDDNPSATLIVVPGVLTLRIVVPGVLAHFHQ